MKTLTKTEECCFQGDITFQRVPMTSVDLSQYQETKEQASGRPVVVRSYSGHHHVASNNARVLHAPDRLTGLIVFGGEEPAIVSHLRDVAQHEPIAFEASGLNEDLTVIKFFRQLETMPDGLRPVED